MKGGKEKDTEIRDTEGEPWRNTAGGGVGGELTRVARIGMSGGSLP